MNTLASRRSAWTSLPMALIGGLSLFLAVPTLADEPSGAQVAALGFMMIIMFVFFAAFYIYAALTLQAIAKRTNTENGWLAWIPIANIILMLNIAKKPIWWIVLCFIPLVNIVIIVIIWMEIAVACKKPNWWGILTLIPIVNLIIMGMLAWAD